MGTHAQGGRVGEQSSRFTVHGSRFAERETERGRERERERAQAQGRGEEEAELRARDIKGEGGVTG